MAHNLKAKSIVIISMIILVSPLITNFLIPSAENSRGDNIDKSKLNISTTSGRIHIDNNWTAAKNAGICTGNGTYSEPYVIEDLVIDGKSSGSCIWIENSSVYFIIENCTVYNSTWAGIRIEQVNNGQLINNTINHHLFGVYLLYSDYNTVLGNNLTDSAQGIWLSSSGHNTVSGNIVNDNGNYGILLVSSSNNNDILGNTVNYNRIGIGLTASNNNHVSGNSLIGNDECIREEDCQGNIFSDNGDCTISSINSFPAILGYNLFFLLGILSVAVIILSKKLKKS